MFNFVLVIFGKTTYDVEMVNPYMNTSYFTTTSHTNKVEWLKIMPDGTLASGSDDKSIKIWNVTTGSVLRTLSGHASAVYCLELLPNGLLISGSEDKSLRIWNTTKTSAITIISNAHSAGIRMIKTINDCYFASGGDDFLVKVGFYFRSSLK